MKKLFLVITLILALNSCSENNYVKVESLKLEGNIVYNQNGEKFTGVGVVTRNRQQLRVKRLMKVKNGDPFEFIEYQWSDDNLNYSEINLSNGLTAYVSDKIVEIITKESITRYYDDGTVYFIKEIYMNENGKDILNGEAKYYDKNGNLEKTEIYKDGILISNNE